MAYDLSSYEEVKDRIRRFLDDYPDGRITTTLDRISDDGKTVFFRALIYKNNEEQEKNLPLATGYAFEKEGSNPVNRTSHVENCETSAIGRALANCNYIKNNARPSREEMGKVIRLQSQEVEQDSQEEPGGLNEKQIAALRKLFRNSKNPEKHRIFNVFVTNHGKELVAWPQEVVSEFEELLQKGETHHVKAA
jgi:hypothetical protein